MEEFDYKEYLTEIGLKKGDIIDVVSDLLSFMIYCREKKLKFNANHLIDTMKEIVGPEGTILIRTFTWAFCRGETFDILNSPSEVGSLGTIALKRSDFQRTKHPIYSWCVWGKDTEYLCKLDNVSSFGKNTPWEFLLDKNASLITLGNTEVAGVTILHHIEQLANVPYRAEKVFESEYIDENGKHSIRRYSMFVRPINIQVENLSDEWWKKLVIEKNIGQNILYNNLLEAKICYYKDIELYMNKEVIDNCSQNIMIIDGEKGYINSMDSLRMARYYS